MSTRIIASISSDIGTALARHWLAAGNRVGGTLRTNSSATESLRAAGAELEICDFRMAKDIERAAPALCARLGPWDAVVIAVGTLEPIGPFEEANFDEWESSVQTNFIGPMRFVRSILGHRHRQAEHGPIVLLFAGGGTNGPTPNFSSYTVSKIAQIKMCELLDSEIPDVRFAIVGPGLVDTKIHEEVYRAKEKSGDVYETIVQRLKENRTVPISRVVECCDWLISAPGEVVSGRNFSCQYDAWGTPQFAELLTTNRDLYKLRRSGN